MKPALTTLGLAACLVASTAFAALSVQGHQAQAANCRATAARAHASADERTRSEGAVREEECLVEATDGVLPTLSRAAGESVDVPNAVQTHRDASASLCSVLSEKSAQLEGAGHPFAKSQCIADRESELARLIDEYAAGGQPPGTVVTGLSTCDDAFKAARKTGEAAAWAALVTCGAEQVNAKVPALVPKVADGDPLALLSHPPEEIAMTFRAAIAAGNGVCDAIVAAPTPTGALLRVRCHAAVVANIAKAVSDRLH